MGYDRGRYVVKYNFLRKVAGSYENILVDENNTRYKNTYFADIPGVWKHGDFIEINNRGGVVIYGRSDTTLNPGGIRIGTSEIYQVLDRIEYIEDSVVVGKLENDDEKIVLFVPWQISHL